MVPVPNHRKGLVPVPTKVVQVQMLPAALMVVPVPNHRKGLVPVPTKVVPVPMLQAALMFLYSRIEKPQIRTPIVYEP